MKQDISPDVAAVKDQFYKGLSLREFVFGLGALVIGFTLILCLRFKLGVQINLAITCGIPVIGAIGIIGFYEINGMYLDEIIRHRNRGLKSPILTYDSMGTMRECAMRKEADARKAQKSQKKSNHFVGNNCDPTE